MVSGEAFYCHLVSGVSEWCQGLVSVPPGDFFSMLLPLCELWSVTISLALGEWCRVLVPPSK